MKRVQASISKAADRLTETDSTAAVRALEAKLDELEAEQATIQEQLSKSKPKPRDFDATFRTALGFLASPWKYWDKGDQHDRQAVLKLVFAAPTPYARDRGFRTAKTTLPFKALGDLDGDGGQMAEGTGLASNLLQLRLHECKCRECPDH
ncbi:hypothetical protein [Aestuariivita sp.]|uniref:hypothetical protein n=1 Tax=Aestuariivita sp. TaxID=1872407 RepID=UPI002171AAD2|nr:hypothetical protein [Aestuariivita sp.]MCE8006397.1 hypothetical protein [Aestuariivita sp.]